MVGEAPVVLRGNLVELGSYRHGSGSRHDDRLDRVSENSRKTRRVGGGGMKGVEFSKTGWKDTYSSRAVEDKLRGN
jgi:hypothetical protein